MHSHLSFPTYTTAQAAVQLVRMHQAATAERRYFHYNKLMRLGDADARQQAMELFHTLTRRDGGMQ